MGQLLLVLANLRKIKGMADEEGAQG